MGQPVRIVEKRTLSAGVLRYEIDRSLSGMGHERYDKASFGAHTKVVRPTEVLAKRLLNTPAVESVHIYSNLITVKLAEGSNDGLLDEILADLFIHYLPGVEPTPV